MGPLIDPWVILGGLGSVGGPGDPEAEMEGAGDWFQILQKGSPSCRMRLCLDQSLYPANVRTAQEV